MLTVACVNQGSKYGPEYVRNLAAGVARWLTAEHEFLCLTDQPVSGVHCVPLKHGLEGWWSKMELFIDGTFDEDDRVLYLDLDTTITGPLDEIAAYEGPFAILRDFYRPWGYCSSVMSWPGNSCADLWDEWCRIGKPRLAGGDQAWVECVRCDAAILQDIFPGKIVSYKAHCRDGLPSGASIINFHGHPKPHECNGWVAECWWGPKPLQALWPVRMDPPNVAGGH